MKTTELLQNEKLPYICTPLAGKTLSEVLKELASVVPKKPDIIEWRVDFFDKINETNEVLAALQEINQHINGIPLLFTIRSEKEGGQPIPLNDNQMIELLCEVCKSKFVQFVDVELDNHVENIQRVRDFTKKYQQILVLSHHNFQSTPKKADIIDFLLKMEKQGADVAKIALMPKSYADVITLFEATKEASKIIEIPLITISMGDIGVMSRVLGWLYGSTVTFAIGEKSSAPGQISIETLKDMIKTVKGERKL